MEQGSARGSCGGKYDDHHVGVGDLLQHGKVRRSRIGVPIGVTVLRCAVKRVLTVEPTHA